MNAYTPRFEVLNETSTGLAVTLKSELIASNGKIVPHKNFRLTGNIWQWNHRGQWIDLVRVNR